MSENEELKECHFCAEKIKVNAKKCKHCGETIDILLRVAEEAKNSNNSPNVYMNAGGGASSNSTIDKEETSIGFRNGMGITLKNEFGQVKYFKTGFSWKMLFFGPLVPLFQGEFYFTLLTIIAILLVLPAIFLPFIYNKELIKRYIRKGYNPMDQATQNYLASKNIHTDIIK